MIKLTNAQKMFNQFNGISNINLEIKPGDKIGVLGPNGVGKSTLLKLMQGLLIPDLGEVTYDNVSVKSKDFKLEKVGFISSKDLFPPQMPVKTYVKFIQELNNNLPNKVQEIAKLLEFDLQNRTKIGKLSTGMMQKLKICLTLGFDREIYFFDEPTSGLDPLSRENFVEYVKNNLQDKTIIYCTHLIEEIEFLCQEVLILKSNTIVKNVPLNQGTSLISIYREIYGKGNKNDEN